MTFSDILFILGEPLLLLLLLLYSLRIFHPNLNWWIFFYWSLSDVKSLQVSRILLSILADFNNAVVCVVSTLPLISYFVFLFSKSFGAVPSAPTAIGVILVSQLFQLSAVLLLLFYSLRVFPTSVSWWPFHWNLRESKSLRVSRTLLSILGRSQQCFSENVFDSPIDFHFLQFLLLVLGDRSECTTTIGITFPFMSQTNTCALPENWL